MRRILLLLFLPVVLSGCLFGTEPNLHVKGLNVFTGGEVKLPLYQITPWAFEQYEPSEDKSSSFKKSLSSCCFEFTIYTFLFVVVDTIVAVPEIIYGSITYPFAKEPEEKVELEKESEKTSGKKNTK